MWQPIQEQHAIAAMAVVLQFSEPLPQRTLRRVVAAAEEPAFAHGLRSRNRTNAFQLQFGELGTPKVETPAEGYVFTSLSRAGYDVDAPDQVSEQLLVDTTRLLYKTTIYASWQAVTERLKTLFLPAADIALQSVSPKTYRLEYLDRFWFDGELNEALADDLLNPASPYLPNHIFGKRQLWHAHTGSFVPSRAGQLLQINADCLDRSDVPAAAGEARRCVDLMTALEKRFTDEEEAAELSGLKLLGGFEEMHADLKVILGEIISGTMSKSIHLNGPS